MAYDMNERWKFRGPVTFLMYLVDFLSDIDSGNCCLVVQSSLICVILPLTTGILEIYAKGDFITYLRLVSVGCQFVSTNLHGWL